MFIGVDMVIFAILFFTFLDERHDAVALFEAGRRTLDPNFGGVNTLILLSSSWCVAMATVRAEQDRLEAIPPWLAGAFFCGLAFTLSKVLEYAGKLDAGFTPATNAFYMHYFVLTALHLLHVIGGTVLLAVLWKMARTGAFHSRRLVVLESGAIYWHMVDLLWILLFPLLYLLRAPA